MAAYSHLGNIACHSFLLLLVGQVRIFSDILEQ